MRRSEWTVSCVEVRLIEIEEPLYKNRDWLYQKVENENISFAQIARNLGVNETTIGRWAKIHNIERTPIWQVYNEKYGDEIERLYTEENATFKDLQNRFGCERGTTIKILNLRGVNIRTSSESAALKKGTYKLNVNYFDKWSSEMAYIVGFINSDGNIIYNEESGNYMLQFGQQADDAEILEKIAVALEYEGVVKIYHTKNINGGDMSVARLVIHSKILVESLMRIGIEERKSLTKGVPDVPDEYIFDYIRGYFDGNGNVDMRYNRTVVPALRLRLISGSRKHLDELQNILSEYGFNRKNIEKAKNENTYTLRFNNAETHILYEKFYRDEESMHMARKKKRFEKCINQRVVDKESKKKNFKRRKGVHQGKVEYIPLN